MLPITSSTALNIFLENLLFLVVSTAFLVYMGRGWENSKPFTLPKPLPAWFSAWVIIVQVVGIALPLVAMILWGVWWSHPTVLQVFLSYFLMLGLQIAFEIVTLRRFQSCVWVMVPYLYLPYRFWQLYTGLQILSYESDIVWVQRLLIAEIVLWTVNYVIDVSQIPVLLRWGVQSESE
jgi:hypothetical protein